MSSMFENCDGLTTLFLEGVTCQSVEYMNHMFSGVSGISDLDLSHFITPKLVNMGSMFKGMVSLVSLDIENMITENVTDMSDVFYGNSNLTIVLFGDFFRTSNVTNMSNMYRGVKLATIDLSNFDTSKVEDMGYMFEGTSSLTNIIFGDSFITENVTNMRGMFGGANVISLDLSGFNTSKVTDMSQMFYNTKNITNIFMGNRFVTTNVINMYQMFDGSSVSELDFNILITKMLAVWNVQQHNQPDKSSDGR